MRVMKKTSGIGELLALALVTGVFLASTLWLVRVIGVDLTPVASLGATFGLEEVAPPPQVGYQPTPVAQPATTLPGSGRASAESESTVAQGGAPFCAQGQAPQFALGFAQLRGHIGEVMGQPVECEHANPENGDSLQRTTTGLAVYRKESGTVTFTDGWRHWALTPSGLVTWEGQASDPPANATAGGV